MEEIKRNSHRYRDIVKQQTIDILKIRYLVSSLTQTGLVLAQIPAMHSEDPTDIENYEIVERCREEAWKSRRNEYLTSLRESTS